VVFLLPAEDVEWRLKINYSYTIVASTNLYLYYYGYIIRLLTGTNCR
jgi:hypothetical protein